MNFIYKNLAVLSLAISCFGDYASSNQGSALQDVNPNPSDRWGTKERGNFFVTGEVVWFRPLNTSQSMFQSYTAQKQTLSYTRNILKNVVTEFQPGFRVSAAYNMPYDGWDLQLIYTRLDYEQTAPLGFGVIGTNALGFERIQWLYNLGDLDLGRLFKVGERFKVRPHFGVRSLWLKQHAEVNNRYYLSGTTDLRSYPTYYGDQKMYPMVGLEGGCEGYWQLSSEFSIYGNIGLSSLIRTYKYKEAIVTVFDNTGSRTEGYIKQGPSTNIVNNLDMTIGVRWDKDINDDEYHFALNVGYEQHTYYRFPINVNTFRTGASNEFMTNQTFNLQGISAGARLDF